MSKSVIVRFVDLGVEHSRDNEDLDGKHKWAAVLAFEPIIIGYVYWNSTDGYTFSPVDQDLDSDELREIADFVEKQNEALS